MAAWLIQYMETVAMATIWRAAPPGRGTVCCHQGPQRPVERSRRREAGGRFRVASFGMVGTDWQQRINWDRMRACRLDRAREAMGRHGLGALLCSASPLEATGLA